MFSVVLRSHISDLETHISTLVSLSTSRSWPWHGSSRLVPRPPVL